MEPQIPARATSGPIEKALANYRLPIVVGIGAFLALSAFYFVSEMIERQQREKAWSALLEASLQEEKTIEKVEGALVGSTAQAWYWLSAAAEAVEKEDFERAISFLDRIERSGPREVRSLGALLSPETSGAELAAAVKGKIAKFQEWKKANGRLFANPAPPTSPKIVLATDEGEIGVCLYSTEATKASENFIKLCKEGFYVGTKIFEVLPGSSLRAGDPTTRAEDPSAWANESAGRLDLDKEKNGLAGFKGSLIAYRNPGESDYSGSQFQILLSNQLGLEPYVFGQVVSGMEVVERIGKIPSEIKGGKNVPSRIIQIKETRVEE